MATQDDLDAEGKHGFSEEAEQDWIDNSYKGVIEEPDLPPEIARDSEVFEWLCTHKADPNAHHVPAAGGAGALPDLTDVTFSGPSNLDILQYNSVTSQWVDRTLAQAGIAAAAHVHAAGDITSGTFLDARIAQSNVTQHEGAINHNALTNYAANRHVVLPNTIANVLSDHNKAGHDALGLSHDSLSDVSANDHHAQAHTIVSHSDVQKFIDTPMSPMVLTGAMISAGTNAGTIKVAAGTFLLRDTDGDTESLGYHSIAETDNITLTSADTAYKVQANYNGGTPIYQVSAVAANGTTIINLGNCLKEADNTIHFTNGGFRFSKGVYKSHHRAAKLREWELSSEIAIGDNTDKSFTVSVGEFFRGINSTSFSLWDSSGTDRFTYVLYYSGSWHYLATQQYIDVDNYNDVTDAVDGLATCNKYKCDWVFVHPDDGHVYVVYGQENNRLGTIEASTIPSGIPDLIDVFGCLIGRIIIKGGVVVFQRIEMANAEIFIPSPVIDHNDLSNPDGGTTDEYYHLTAAQHTIATQAATNALSGYATAAHITAIEANTDKVTCNFTNVNTALAAANAPIDINSQNLTNVGYLQVGANAGGSANPGDIVARRSATTGAYYFGEAATKYLYYDATDFQLAGGGFNVADHNASTVGLKLGGTLVTASAAELNILDGKTAFEDGATADQTEAEILTLLGLTSIEVDQVGNIAATTISEAQWGYLGSATAAGGAILGAATNAAILTLLSGDAGAAFDWNSQNLTGVGTIGCGTITTTGNLVLPANGVIGVTDGNPQIVFDNANNWLEITGKVGIGTATPGYNLEVAGTIFSSDLFYIQHANPGFWLDETGVGNKGCLFVLDGLTFQIQRRTQGFGGYETTVFAVNINTGVVTIANLAGVGSRTVVADAYGVLSAP